MRVFETREVCGLIFAWWGIGDREPQWRLPADPPDQAGWTSLAIRTTRFPGHPQETSENSVDLAHLRYVHGYGNVGRADPVSVDGPCLKSRFDFRTTRTIARIATLTLDFSTNTQVVGLGYSFVEMREHSIGMDMRLWILATPVDGTLIDLSLVSQVRELRNPKRRIVGLAFLPRRLRAPVMNKFMARQQKRDVQQDVVIWSRKRYQPRPRLRSDGEITPSGPTRFYDDGEIPSRDAAVVVERALGRGVVDGVVPATPANTCADFSRAPERLARDEHLNRRDRANDDACLEEHQRQDPLLQESKFHP